MTNRQVTEPVIFHIDVNSAYLSWSAIKLLSEGYEIDLREVPSIVGGDQKTRHGIVVAKSLLAASYGIHTADTVASALQKCPDLIMTAPDHSYYHEKSRQLMGYLSGICNEIQQVSVDECYMSFEPIRDQYTSPKEAAKIIKDGVFEKFGYTVNVGISNKKVLAKMASDFKKPNLIHTLYDWEIRLKLWPLPIEKLHMCGKSSAAALRKMGIHTIGDLAKLDPGLVESWLKSHGRLLWNYANGIDDSRVESDGQKAKGIGNSTTLAQNAVTREECRKVLKQLTDKVVERIKKHNVLASQIAVEIKYDTFVSSSHQMGISPASADCRRLYEYVKILFDELWTGEPVRLLGVRATKLEDKDEPVQLNLFDYQKEKVVTQKQKNLNEAMEKIRLKYGADAIQRGI